MAVPTDPNDGENARSDASLYCAVGAGAGARPSCGAASAGADSRAAGCGLEAGPATVSGRFGLDAGDSAGRVDWLAATGVRGEIETVGLSAHQRGSRPMARSAGIA